MRRPRDAASCRARLGPERAHHLQVGKAIEESMGSAQDIEGVVDCDGNITVVQTRPQV